MSIFSAKKSIRNLGRYREIIGVLLKYGFEEVVDQLNVDTLIKRIRARTQKKHRLLRERGSRSERIRMALEELGPTFIKLGQMLSTRYDLLPLETINELRKLQSEVKPFSEEKSVQIVEDELNASIETLFSCFEKKPFAAASISQVHRATTLSGKDVVVKVQRPDIQVIIENDIPILVHLADLVEKHVPESRVFDPSGLVEQFKKWIVEELNFMQEARNAHRFRKNFAAYKTVHVPKVFWDLTTERVLTMEYIGGIYIDRIDQLVEAGIDPVRIARNGTLFILRQIFKYHFFHGDPHPSNLMVLPNHVIAPLDYGLMGRMDDEMVAQIGDLMHGIIKSDASEIVRTLINLNRSNADVDRETLRIDVADFLARYHAVPLHLLRFEHFFNDLVKLIRQHQIRFPRNMYLMGKSLMVVEGIAQNLDPQYDIIAITQSYFTGSMMGKTAAEKMLRDTTQMIEDYADLAVMAPRTINQILKKTRWGDLAINLKHLRIDDMLRQVDRSANRMALSIITGSLILASAIIMHLDRGPSFWDLPVLGVVGLGVAGILGIWLVLSIWRSGQV